MEQHNTRDSGEPEPEPPSQSRQLPPPEDGIESEPPWSLNPTVFNPTPRLHHLSYPPPLQINLPHVASQASTREPQREIVDLSTTGAHSLRSSSPLRVPHMSRSSTQSAMRQSQRTHTRTTSRVSFDTSGRTSKKAKRTGWREPASLEDLFG